MVSKLVKILNFLILPSAILFAYVVVVQGEDIFKALEDIAESKSSEIAEPYYNLRFTAALSLFLSSSNAGINSINSALSSFEKGNYKRAVMDLETATQYIRGMEEALPQVKQEIYDDDSEEIYNMLVGMVEAQKKMVINLKSAIRKARIGEDYNTEIRNFNIEAMRYQAYARRVMEFQSQKTGIVTAG